MGKVLGNKETDSFLVLEVHKVNNVLAVKNTNNLLVYSDGKIKKDAEENVPEYWPLKMKINDCAIGK